MCHLLKIKYMKKYFLVCLLIGLITFGISTIRTVIADAFVYSSPTGHYSLTLPSGWIRTSQYTLAQKISNAVQQGGVQAPENYIGFQASSSTFPSMTIYEFPTDNASYSQIKQELSSGVNQRIPPVNEKYPGLNAAFGEPFIDKNRNMVFINLTANVPGVGAAHALEVYVLGKNIDLSLDFYSLESDYPNELPVFDSIINSFQFENGYEYDPSAVQNVDTKKYSIWIGTGTIILFGVWQAFRKKKSPGSKKNGEVKPSSHQ